MAELINPGGGHGDGAGETPKIHIDSDWKAEAQKERERLAEAERAQQEAAPEGGPGAMPEADLTAIIRMIATQALLYMGGIPDPETGRAVVAPEYARYHIDLLGALDEKTKGNRTEAEEQELAGLLNELRMRFVDLMGAVDEAMARRAQEGAGADETSGGEHA
ncbi:MAG: DUF1844 domain-containing protein [Phycisphaerales bacterium]